MTVIFLPDYTGDNPYQTNLACALDEEVVFGGCGRFLPILRAVRTNKDVSVVHFHWLHPYIFAGSGLKTAAQLVLTTFQLLVLRLQDVRMVWTAHNVLSHESPYPWLERWFKHMFIRLGFCSGIFVHCEAARKRIIEEYNIPEETVNQQARVLPHGHYLDNYEDEFGKMEARTELKLRQDQTVFLYFGQIKPYKGILDLIDTFKSVEAPNSHLLVVGRPVNESLSRIVQEKSVDDDRINTVLEFIPDEDVQLYMNASDCVVLPYNKITTSGSAILAMSFGKAIIIPRLGCIPELLDEEGSLMYSPGDEDGLQTALVRALNCDLVSMGNQNKQLVREYDWKAIGAMTSHVYMQ